VWQSILPSPPLSPLLPPPLLLIDVHKSLRQFFHPRHDPGVILQSYLYIKSSSKYTGGSSWLRRWFILEGSKLYYMREGRERSSSTTPTNSGGGGGGSGEGEGGEERMLVCDVVLSTVREVGGGGSNGCSGNISGSSSSSGSEGSPV